ncbi:esterase-like activity of phytase family protein [Actinopolymorpha sp. B17G11]|uniref:esterase-like activity of phytase family protein n=1 Tax=Actinopolymorpha sp. B17G11 TaxID=3160861 RepID=UPI0032E42600
MRLRVPFAVRRLVVAVAVVAVTAVVAAVSATAAPAESPERPDRPAVRVLGEETIPKGLAVDGMPIGELSGIDYDARNGLWYLISDDSEEAPARFYTADLDLDAHGLSRVRFIGATRILRTDGTPFPPLASDDSEVADPEAIRLDPRSRTLYWSSEGKRDVPTDGSPAALVDPWVRQMTLGGRHIREFRQPSQFTMSAGEQGPRRNAVFEGLTLTADRRELVASLEGPLYDDGPLPTPTTGAVSRLTWYDKRSGAPVRQFAYDIDPIPAVPDPPTAGADNGVVELLPIDQHRLLVLERAFISGVGNSIRLYAIDVRGATNTLDDTSLADGDYRPVRKRLVVDLADLDLSHIDNVEGMAWGPRLPTGERTLVLVSDDNFNAPQVSQVIALALRVR